jgi:hypothetical protein
MSDCVPTRGETVAGLLVREIIRVAEKRQRWRLWGREDPTAALSFHPGIVMMTQALDLAVGGLERQDAVQCLNALELLRGFDSDD